MDLQQMAESHADNLEQKVFALRVLGEGLTLDRIDTEGVPILIVTGSVQGKNVGVHFKLDSEANIRLCALYSQRLTNLIKSLPLPMGETIQLGGAA